MFFVAIHCLCFFFSGSLLTRNLGDLVQKEDFVVDSEYLITLLVVVPKWVIHKIIEFCFRYPFIRTAEGYSLLHGSFCIEIN
jgi:hypothetical protein